MTNREAELDHLIVPLMRRVADECERLGIPYIATFQFSDDDLCTFSAVPEDACWQIAEAVRAIDPLGRVK